MNQPIDGSLNIKEEDEFPEIPPIEHVFNKYEFQLPLQKLPIAQKRAEIVKELEKNKILIIRAETGKLHKI